MLKVTVARPQFLLTLIGAMLVSSAAFAQPSTAPATVVAKWLPPVVELLVDPWAKAPVAAPAGRPRWLPCQPEIVDPWADEAPPSAPRVASQQAGPPRSTIF